MITIRLPASAITDDVLTALYDERDRLRAEARINLRDCLMPGCRRQFDVGARLEGKAPARPEWSGDGWRLFSGLLPGPDYGCPDHADLITAHVTHTARAHDGALHVVCACRWSATGRRWHGAARGLWEEHLLAVLGDETEETRRA
ncbi:hypothetical protein D7231_31970 [Streptomyces klenkii]|uniref:Uncharacterized protein n=1 Tax=Streptomyces klenkii TaxID=1420899 RepID=A0A3B0AMD4_9ACTN|nr:hypothetical protein [Streptomyces klenkii]RKN61890.1 hypothetical protein D7231_31970 [Streptomyces klenkii]